LTIPSRIDVNAQDAYNYAASKFFADQQLCIVLKLNGKIDESVFAKSVRLTLDLEPILGCRLVNNGGSIYWERRNDLNQLKLCELVTVDNEEVLQAFINAPVSALVDLLVTSKIFRGKDFDTICIKMNHSACDAAGLKEYVAILANIYNKTAAGEKFALQPNLGRRDQTQLFELTKDPKSLALKDFPGPTWAFPQKEGTQPIHAFRAISCVQFEAIKKYAHDNNVTINDVLLTALYRRFFVLNSTAVDKPMMFQISIDLRRYLPNHKAEAICNLSGALYVALERKQRETFEETIARIAVLTNKLKADYPGIESAAGLEYLFRQGYVGLEKYLAESAAIGKKCNVTFPLLSNFGILNKYQFGDLHATQGYLSSPILYQPGFMLGATTFNGEMTLSIGYCGQQNTGQITDFLDAYIAELPK
jgi:NRPS condensation-like uncharacterized protein